MNEKMNFPDYSFQLWIIQQLEDRQLLGGSSKTHDFIRGSCWVSYLFPFIPPNADLIIH